MIILLQLSFSLAHDFVGSDLAIAPSDAAQTDARRLVKRLSAEGEVFNRREGRGAHFGIFQTADWGVGRVIFLDGCEGIIVLRLDHLLDDTVQIDLHVGVPTIGVEGAGFAVGRRVLVETVNLFPRIGHTIFVGVKIRRSTLTL